MRRAAALAVLVLWGFLFLPGCDGTGEFYRSHVDRVEPAIPGLAIEGGGSQGGIYITNDTGKDVYIFDQSGQEVWKITPTESFHKKGQGNWVRATRDNLIFYMPDEVEYCGSYCGLPRGRYRGEVMKEWVISGRAGDTPFKIYGRTVYEPVE